MFKEKVGIYNKAIKFLPFLVLILIVYIIYSLFVLTPSNKKHFSLIDDGQVFVQTSTYFDKCVANLDCEDYLDRIAESGSPRFRPAYWLINTSIYKILGDNAQRHHEFRVYAVGVALILLLYLVLLDAGGNKYSFVIASLIFLFNYSYTENIVRLGTNEPFQIIFIVLFSLLYLNKNKILDKRIISKTKLNLVLVLLVVWLVMIKETNIAIVPTIIFTNIMLKKTKVKEYNLILILPVTVLLLLGIYITRGYNSSNIITAIYPSNYVNSVPFVFDNAKSIISSLTNSTSPFIKVLLVTIPFVLVVKKLRYNLIDKKFLYWLNCFIFFTLILFPWRFALERYQLPSIFFLAIVVGLVVGKSIDFFKVNIPNRIRPSPPTAFLIEIFIFALIVNLFFRGFPVNLAKSINYSNWYSVFLDFEAAQVNAIAKHNDVGVFINAEKNLGTVEVLYEIPLHLTYIHKLKSNLTLVENDLPNEGLLFSRTPFDSKVKIEDLDNYSLDIIEFSEYYVEQIDPLEFREKFRYRPLQALFSPPMKNEGYELYWEIRKL